MKIILRLWLGHFRCEQCLRETSLLMKGAEYLYGELPDNPQHSQSLGLPPFSTNRYRHASILRHVGSISTNNSSNNPSTQSHHKSSCTMRRAHSRYVLTMECQARQAHLSNVITTQYRRCKLTVAKCDVSPSFFLLSRLPNTGLGESLATHQVLRQ